MNNLNSFFNKKFEKYLPKDIEPTKGFFLFNPPTGSGKTTATIDYIVNNINNSSKRKIFFITNLKENLDKPFKKLQEKVNSQKILRLLAVEDELCRLCEKKLWEKPKTYKFKWYDSFKDAVELYANNRKNRSDEYKAFLKSKYEEKEQKFKNEIFFKIDELKKSNNRVELGKLKNELKKIYRTIDLTKDYDVVFLTTQKFLYPIYDPFLGSDYIYNLKEFKDNSICFIDEFDSQKDIFLKIEIDKFVEETKDYISIFLKLYSGLEYKRFFKKFEFQEELEELRKHFSKIHARNNLQYSHKLEDDLNRTNILFKDIEYFSVDKKFYNLQTDNNIESNIISQFDVDEFNKVKNKSLGLLTTLNDVIVSINYFTSIANRVSQKYYNKHKDRLEFSNAISTVLNEVNIPKNDKIHKFLKDRILERNRIDSYYSDWSKNSFYDKGFRYFSFHNSIDFDTKTNIDFKLFNNTPEKILAEIAEHTFIVGISATAMNKSVTSNFKLEYLKTKFSDNFAYLNKEELIELEKLYIDAKKDKLENYQVEIIDYNYGQDEIFEFKKESLELFGTNLEDWIEGHQYRYYINRYFKIVKAYLSFKENDDIQSFLCLLTTYPKDDMDKNLRGINKEHLDYLIVMALEKRNLEYDNKDKLYFIYDSKTTTSEEYENEIKPRLTNGEKIFVISVYQSIGIGKNIQYKVSNNKGEEVEKDFDAIYLDKPTFLLERLDGESIELENEKRLIKYIYQLETLFTDAEITRENLEKSIKSAFNTTFNQVPFQGDFSHAQTEDYLYSASKVIIQAVGRLHRTKDSGKKFIFIDKELSFLDSYQDKNSFTLLSFKQILEKLKSVSNDKKNIEFSITQIVNEKNFKVKGVIEDSLEIINSYQNLKNEERIREWQEIREFVLKNPTLKNIDNSIKDKYELFYFKYKDNSENQSLQYFYKQEYDYRNVKINWKDKSGYIEVSSKNSKLDLIRNNSYLKKKFEENGYALYFNTTSLYMMIPIVYNNIYKGVLGEKIGKFLLEQEGNLKLIDLDRAEFEMFDYKTENNVYIDFKYFGESTGLNIDVEKLISKAKDKLNLVNGKKAIIVNCFGDANKYGNKPIKKDNILIYPFVIDMESKIDYKVISEIKEEIFNAD